VKACAEGSHGGGDDVLARELSRSMLRGVAPAVGLDEGLASAFTCFGIDEAMETGRVVEMSKYLEEGAVGVLPGRQQPAALLSAGEPGVCVRDVSGVRRLPVEGTRCQIAASQTRGNRLEVEIRRFRLYDQDKPLMISSE